jgi:hypothetical protein
MSGPEDYRRFAKACVELARMALNERSKAALLQCRLADEHARDVKKEDAD